MRPGRIVESGAGAANHEGRFSVNQNVVSGIGIGVPRHVRDSAPGLRHHPSLPRRTRKRPAESSTGCPAANAGVPHRLAIGRTVGCDQTCPASGQHEGTRRGEVDMVHPVSDAIGHCIFAGRHSYRDAEHARLLRESIEVLHRLFCPCDLRVAPSNRKHARLVKLVVDRRAHSIRKSARRVGGEINGDRRSRRNGSCHFNIQRHLTVRALRRGGAVFSLIDGDAFQSRRLQSQSVKVLANVCRTIAAAELDEADRLSVSSGVLRESVKLCHCGGV